MTIDIENDLHEKLSKDGISFSNKLKIVCMKGELDYWNRRKNPPNESVDSFTKFVKMLRGDIKVKWVERISRNGGHAELGENDCFKFEKEVSNFGLKKKYFVKGYFFDKGNLKGVTIQSFREVKISLVKSIK
jgi:predicted metal-binding protein